MVLAGAAPLPQSTGSCRSRAAPRAAGRRRGARPARGRLRERQRIGRSGPARAGAARRRRRPPPRQHALRAGQPRRRRRLVDGRGARGRHPGARRRAHAGPRRGALHRRSSRTPVASSTRTRRRRRCGSRPNSSRRGGRARVFQGVYETVQFAKLKLLARALERAQVYEGGRVVVSYLLRTDFPEVGAVEPYSEGIIDSLRAVEGARLAALIREPPRDDGPPAGSSCARSVDESTCPRLRAGGGGGHRQAAGFSSEASIEEITDFVRASFCLRAGLNQPGSSSSTSRRGPRPLRLSRSYAARRGATGHAGTLDPFATGLLLLLSGRATKLASCFVGLDKRYVTDVDLTARTTTGDPEGEVVEEMEPPSRGRARAAARGPPR